MRLSFGHLLTSVLLAIWCAALCGVSHHFAHRSRAPARASTIPTLATRYAMKAAAPFDISRCVAYNFVLDVQSIAVSKLTRLDLAKQLIQPGADVNAQVPTRSKYTDVDQNGRELLR